MALGTNPLLGRHQGLPAANPLTSPSLAWTSSMSPSPMLKAAMAPAAAPPVVPPEPPAVAPPSPPTAAPAPPTAPAFAPWSDGIQRFFRNEMADLKREDVEPHPNANALHHAADTILRGGRHMEEPADASPELKDYLGAVRERQEFDDFVAEHKGLASHAAKAGKTPQQFLDAMFGEGHQVTHIDGDGKRLFLDADLANGGRMQREFLPSGAVDHTFFKIPEEAQKDGTGKRLLSQQIPLYREMGRKRVDVHADIDVGGYAWSRYGFVPSATDWHQLRRTASDDLDGLKGQLPEHVFSRMKAATADRDPRAMWTLADEQTPVKTKRYMAGKAGLHPWEGPLGKHLFLGTDWRGKMDLNDPAVIARFDKYVSEQR